jgi:anti-sigma regulatory factor (Ser/Thr protein kinase)
MRLLVSLNLPDDLALIPMLRRVSREVLLSCQVDVQDIDDLELLVGELATNAARHSRVPQYRVDIELFDGFAVVTVTDTGRGFERQALPPPGTIRPGDGTLAEDGEEGRIGGWGLPLVERLADEVEYLPANPHGTVIRVTRRYHNARTERV